MYEAKEALKTGMKDFVKDNKKMILILGGLIILVIIFLLTIPAIITAVNKKVFNKEILKVNNCESYTTCSYTGVPANNYVWYSGFMWRIIKTNNDGSVRVISEDPLTSIPWYIKENNDYYNSYVRTWLKDGVLLPKLRETDKYLISQEFCYGEENGICSKKINDEVGLLNISEYDMAGGKSSFLNFNDAYWTITTWSDNDALGVWYIDSEGNKQNNLDASKILSIRPVINLRGTLEIVKGTNGTKDNPYRFVNDNSAKANDLLNTRYAGEYVDFAGKTWRIVSGGEYTKLILDGYDIAKPYNKAGTVERAYRNDKADPTGENVLTYLNRIYYNILKGTTPEIDRYIETQGWFNAPLNEGEPYTNVNIENNTRESMAIGLIKLGEIFSANDLKLTNNNLWTLTSTKDGQVYLSSPIDVAKPTEINFARPVINLRKSVYIVSGTGRTKDSPYEISIE